MGKAENGSILKRISGKVGPVSVCINGVVKIKPSKRKTFGKKEDKSPTEEQSILTLVSRFFVTLPKDFFKKGFQVNAKKGETPRGLSMSYHLKNAVTGTFPDLGMKLSQLRFSQAALPIENAWNPVFRSIGGDRLEVRWELNPFPDKNTNLDDEAVIVFYNIKTHGFRYQEGISRSWCGYDTSTIPSYRNCDIACWMFFLSEDKTMVSDTAYLGIVKSMS